jgi:hypothetical protein
MVKAIECNPTHRANVLTAYHVLELMHAFYESARLGQARLDCEHLSALCHHASRMARN